MLDASRVFLASPRGCWPGGLRRGPSLLLALAAVLALPAAVAAAPPVPSQPAAACGAVVGTECYVGGAFTLSSYSAGAHHYAICRSNDTTGWGGCDVLVSANTGSLSTISGSHLPSNGYRRAYYFAACDAANSCTAWGASPPAYVRMDQTGPSAPGNTAVACNYTSGDNCWVLGNFTVSASPASDSGAGVSGYRICRSVDISGWGGCDVDMVGIGSGGTSFTVSGTHLPSDGSRRAYYFAAMDRVGNHGTWNNPRFVRVDRYGPTVSATNSSTQWFTSRTATISAADATGGAAANSGLATVRYRWNGSLDMGCVSGGTATFSGAVLTAPEGANTLYLCARDNTGRASHWAGYYYVDTGPPTAPGPTTVACAYTVSDECWVTGNFVASVTPATDSGTGVAGYRICRSVDITGWGGCDYDMVPIGTGGTSFTVSGTNLPSDGYRRAYYFQAKDAAGSWGPWNNPRFVKVDRYNPTVSGTGTSSQWKTSNFATVTAFDTTGGSAANSGLAHIRFRWNAALNAACSDGTAVAHGGIVPAPEGANTLHLCARDQTGRVGTWSGPFAVDSTGPSLDSLAVSAGFWSIADGSTYQITAKASDAGSGVRELRALINLHGDNAANPRGNFSWQDQSLGYLWTGDQVPCAGGGFASKRPDAYNPDTISLVGCSTTLVGGQRTVVFTVRPHSTFGEFGPVNDISFWARDFVLNAQGWQNFDLNFASGLRPPPVLQVLGPNNAVLANGATVAWGDVDQGAGSGVVAKTITVKNVAPAGSGNLVLEHSPSNVEITGSSAFTIGGSLVSPLAVGAQDGFNVRLNTNQVGQHSAQLKIWHNDPARPNPAVVNLTARVLADPVVTGTTPDVMFQGLSTTITVNGQYLQGASVYIATQPYQEGGTSNRVYPTAQLVSVNSTGTQLRATINAQAAGIAGFYNLAIETPGGATGAQFRVVGSAPIVDVFTPSQTVQGQIHLLTVNGVNLAGANLIPNTSDVKVLDLDNTDDRSLMGLLYVESGAPVGSREIRIQGSGGFAQIPLQVESSEGNLTLETRRLEIPGKAGGPDVPDILLQQPVSLLHLQKGLGKSGEAIDPATAMGPGEPHYLTPLGDQVAAAEVDEKFHFCATYVRRARWSFNAILLSLTDQFGNPLTRAVLDALAPGTRLNFNSLTLAISGFLEIEFVFRICEDGITDLIFCFRGGIAFMVPFLGGQSFTFDICAGLPGTSVTLAANGFITNHTWSSNSSCVNVSDDNPSSQSGARSGAIDVNCCGQADVSLQTSGVAFERSFNVGGEVATIKPYCPAQDSNTFLVVVRAFIPVNYADSPSPLDICRLHIGGGSFVDRDLVFAGDERGPEAEPNPKNLSPLFPKAYRMVQEIRLIPDQNQSLQGWQSGTQFTQAGETLAYSEGAVADGRLGPEDWDWPNTDDCIKFHQWKVATVVRSFDVQRLENDKVRARLVAAAPNPLSLFSPDIDWDVEVTLEKQNASTVAWTVHARHDCMPAYEVFINGQLVYSFLPPGSSGTTIPASQFLICLPAPMDVDRVESGVFRY